MQKMFCDKCGMEIGKKGGEYIAYDIGIQKKREASLRVPQGINEKILAYEICSKCCEELLKLFKKEGIAPEVV